MATGKESPNLAAVLLKPKARITIQERAIPTPGPNDLLIRNHAIAANPVDWKIQDYSIFIAEENYPTILGSDVCGTVISIGSSVTKFAIGDRVNGYSAVIYNSEIDHGAWQTYTLLREISATKIPASMKWEEGAVFPMAVATAGVGLFLDLGFPRPPKVVENVEKEALLVWGGAGSVGAMAVQMAKSLGVKVFATASPANKEYIESLGAANVFDYRDPDVVSKILDEAKRNHVTITRVFDTVTENGTVELSEQVLAGNGKGGSLAVVLPVGEHNAPEGVNITMVGAYRIGTDQTEFGEWLFNEWLREALEKKTIVPAPKIRVVEGGIGATQEVFDIFKKGVSATKLVVKVE